ncbi:MAG: hypothetical protein KDJ69_10035 [Nitratireductor sp.]|nr:hypothetical protein [Nitratireductor sp.]
MTPAPEITIPAVVTTVGLATWFGHDVTFWTAVGCACVLKLVTSDPVTDRDGRPLKGRARAGQLFASFLAAVLPPFLATKALAEILAVQSRVVENLIAVGLVIIGEGIVRWMIRVSQKPEGLIELVLRIYRGGGSAK